MTEQHISLNELTLMVRSAIYGSLPDTVWVVAEISELNLNKTGHCYLELVEKEASGDRITARMKAMIWANIFRNVRSFFESTTGYSLKAGIKILALVQVEFHDVYGLSLNIRDIDPSYTLGDIARQKQEAIDRLRAEGVFDMNRSIGIPPVIQRIAVISSETAAGYGDFMDSIRNNKYGISFYTSLFPAIMQGEKAEASIVNAFDEIYGKMESFDVVVLIRGGGSQAELGCFNSYELAFYITQFPLPVITGIGHERDQSVADMVAGLSLKTPTAVAEYIINATAGFIEELSVFAEQLVSLSSGIIEQSKDELKYKALSLSLSVSKAFGSTVNKMNSTVNNFMQSLNQFTTSKRDGLLKASGLININASYMVNNAHVEVNRIEQDIPKRSFSFLKDQLLQINHSGKSIEHLNPERVLQRGFSITRKGGRLIKNSKELNVGDIIETSFSDGKISSKVEN